ncbi:hypothetical protein FB107DRAFT_245648 [Schizophyllum commune]
MPDSQILTSIPHPHETRGPISGCGSNAACVATRLDSHFHHPPAAKDSVLPHLHIPPPSLAPHEASTSQVYGTSPAAQLGCPFARHVVRGKKCSVPMMQVANKHVFPRQAALQTVPARAPAAQVPAHTPATLSAARAAPRRPLSPTNGHPSWSSPTPLSAHAAASSSNERDREAEEALCQEEERQRRLQGEHETERRREEEEEARKASPELEFKRATSERRRRGEGARDRGAQGARPAAAAGGALAARAVARGLGAGGGGGEEATGADEEQSRGGEEAPDRGGEEEGGGVSSPNPPQRFSRNHPSHVGASSGAAFVDALHLDIARYGPVFEGFGLRLGGCSGAVWAAYRRYHAAQAGHGNHHMVATWQPWRQPNVPLRPRMGGERTKSCLSLAMKLIG